MRTSSSRGLPPNKPSQFAVPCGWVGSFPWGWRETVRLVHRICVLPLPTECSRQSLETPPPEPGGSGPPLPCLSNGVISMTTPVPHISAHHPPSPLVVGGPPTGTCASVPQLLEERSTCGETKAPGSQALWPQAPRNARAELTPGCLRAFNPRRCQRLFTGIYCIPKLHTVRHPR